MSTEQAFCAECGGDGIDSSHEAALYYAARGDLSPCPRCGGTGRQAFRPDAPTKGIANYYCDNCGGLGLCTLRDGAICLLCRAESRESFRAGWDESD